MAEGKDAVKGAASYMQRALAQQVGFFTTLIEELFQRQLWGLVIVLQCMQTCPIRR